jgi:hypothetical protein
VDREVPPWVLIRENVLAPFEVIREVIFILPLYEDDVAVEYLAPSPRPWQWDYVASALVNVRSILTAGGVMNVHWTITSSR